jgi:hypothetical protein
LSFSAFLDTLPIPSLATGSVWRVGGLDFVLQDLSSLVPQQGVEILLVVFLSFLIGLEREGGRGVADRYRFGGIRTFPLIGMTGYAMGLLAGDGWGLIAAGFAVVGAFLLLSYWHKLQTQTVAGVTTEISGLTTYLIGVLISAIISGWLPRWRFWACCCSN